MSIRASYTSNCLGCQRRVTWTGRIVDQPSCTCGHVLDRAALALEQRELDRIVAPLRPLGATHAR